MPIYFLLRILTILIVVVSVTTVPTPKAWLAFVYSIALAHYLMALIYSRRQIAEAFRQPHVLLPLFSVAILGTTMYMASFLLIFYFGLHHAFNEAFILRGTIPAEDDNVKAFRGSAVIVHLMLYLFIVRRQAGIVLGPANPLFGLAGGRSGTYLSLFLLLGALAVAYVFFFYYLYRIRRFLDLKSLIENCGFELVGLVVALVSIQVFFSYLHVVLYHVVFWTLFPLPKIASMGMKQLASYLGLTAVFSAAFLLLSPLGLFPSRYASALFAQQFYIWTVVHITSSFLLSNAHPEWIVNLFRSKAPAALAKA